MRLIDADALEPDADYDDGEYWAVSIVQIYNAPTIEPERKTGHWIKWGNRVKCDQCALTNRYSKPFCPNCGADMMEGD